MQKNGPFKLPTYAVTIMNPDPDHISDVKQFAIEQFLIDKKKNNTSKMLIIDHKNECSSIDSKYNYIISQISKSKPKSITLDSININQYKKIFCIIDPTTYDDSSEMTIKLLANKSVETHYFILKKSIHLAILERIDHIYLQADAKKFTQLEKLNKQNTFADHLKQNVYSFVIPSFKIITSNPILCLIIILTDHPDFPWPYWQPIILNGFPVIIMLKTLISDYFHLPYWVPLILDCLPLIIILKMLLE